MTPNDIRESGLLEYYVLQLLSAEDTQRVEGYLMEFPELEADLLDIQNSLQTYAVKRGITPSHNLKDKITESIRSKGDQVPNAEPTPSGSAKTKPTNSTGGGIGGIIFPLLLGLAALVASYMAYNYAQDVDTKSEELSQLQKECEEKEKALQNRIDLFDALNSPNNKVLSITPTDGYQETNLLFHNNPNTKKNFIQIRNLPAIADGQAFQLWSLKGGDQAPIPLTVFKSGDDYIVEVDYEEGTATYAITIEVEGGVQSPTLARLIGTVNV